jgi:hypothetical protein
MRVNSLGDLFKQVSEQKSKKEKIDLLRKNNHPGLQTMLQLMLDEQIEWILPPGTPPFTPNPHLDNEGILYGELRRMYIFMKNGAPNLKPDQRENIFIQILESVTPSDAQLLIALKDKKAAKMYGINKKLIEETFGG